MHRLLLCTTMFLAVTMMACSTSKPAEEGRFSRTVGFTGTEGTQVQISITGLHAADDVRLNLCATPCDRSKRVAEWTNTQDQLDEVYTFEATGQYYLWISNEMDGFRGSVPIQEKRTEGDTITVTWQSGVEATITIRGADPEASRTET